MKRLARFNIRFFLTWFLIAPTLILGLSLAAEPSTNTVTAPPPAVFELVREKYRPKAKEFYTKFLPVGGMPVLASTEVSDAALQRTRSIVLHLLAGRPD